MLFITSQQHWCYLLALNVGGSSQSELDPLESLASAILQFHIFHLWKLKLWPDFCIFLDYLETPGTNRRELVMSLWETRKSTTFLTHRKKTHFGHKKDEFLHISSFGHILFYHCLIIDMFLNLFLLILSFTSWRSFLIGTRSTKHQKGFPGDWLASGVVLKVIEILRKNFDISFKIHNLLELSWENSCRKTISYKIWSKHNFNQEKNKCLWDGSLATGEFSWGVLRLGSFAQKAEE